ncbi:type II/IV secretion system ATPase subunit [Halolamina salifodinae]|uniref:Flagellar protein FlaI n=1 Tax=Halolamina salifodinae TaxID=1202767 RepID=A0A8T4GV14_9EURY|nr:type II/IV secretion system ATPase subunit [Halolamina salifodinae]MBP1986736.1 flagellar protein FlaI [Halolamina salifodinae]
MATDDADSSPSALEGEVEEGAEPADGAGSGPEAVVGSYTWGDFLREHGEPDAAAALYERFEATPGSERWGEGEAERTLTPEDWEGTDIDPAEYLGFPPWEIEARIGAAHRVAADITDYSPLIGYENTPVIKDIYGWEDYKREYFYTDEGEPPTDGEGEPESFDAAEALGFAPEALGATMADCERAGEELTDLIDERTVDVDEEVDEDAFFSDPQGRTTVANRYDLEKTVPMAKKTHFREEDRYWVNKPYSYVVIFHSTKENEKKYYVIQPHLTEIEQDLSDYLTDKLRASIKYEDGGSTAGDEEHRRSVIENKTRELLDRYDLYEDPNDSEKRRGLGNTIVDKFGVDPGGGLSGRVIDLLGYEEPTEAIRELVGIEVRPEPVLLEEDADILNEYQVEKLLYYLERDFIGYERIDGIKHDINVEDISCDGYNSPVFVYHSDYEQIITNIYHGEKELDDFVVKLAQRSGKGISKRRPQVDATLPDGSRAQLTLGREVSDHGTNYTIRQFKDVPFTPVDLINWQTFSLDEMAFLWLCIENHKSLIFAGGTASGKTTSLNAVSLFIPSNSKIVSIEDTREVELPQRNWIASVTRPSFSDDDKGDVDEFDLLEAALRQRPDYIVMGEIRGEEGRTLFQVMSTGHTTYTTFHADNVGEVLKRFTTEPINVSKTMFTALDLVSIQTSTRVQGHKVRRNKSLTEINHYDAENDEINVQDVYQWQAETDEFLKMGDSNTLDEIMFDRGWDHEKLDLEIFKRRVVLAYLIHEGLNTYTQVAATFQAFINDPETILSLMANDQLEASLEDLREMESVLIDIDPEKEEMVPRPDPNEGIMAEAEEILAEAEERLFEQYYGETPDDVADALVDTQPQGNVEATHDAAGELPAGADEPSAADEAVEIGEDEQGRSALGDVAEAETGGPTPELEASDEGAEEGVAEVDEADIEAVDEDESEPVDEPGGIDDTPADADTDAAAGDAADIADSDDDSSDSDEDTPASAADAIADTPDDDTPDEDGSTEMGVLPESEREDEAVGEPNSGPEISEGSTADQLDDDPAIGGSPETDEAVDNTPEPDEWDPFEGNEDTEYVIGVPEDEEMDDAPDDDPDGSAEAESDPEYTIGVPEDEQDDDPEDDQFGSVESETDPEYTSGLPEEGDDELDGFEEPNTEKAELADPELDEPEIGEPELGEPETDGIDIDEPEFDEPEPSGIDVQEPDIDATEETNGGPTGWKSSGSSVDEGYTIRSPEEEDDESAEAIDEEPSFDLSPDPAELTGDDETDDEADLFDSDDENDDVDVDSWKLDGEDDLWEGEG